MCGAGVDFRIAEYDAIRAGDSGHGLQKHMVLANGAFHAAKRMPGVLFKTPAPAPAFLLFDDGLVSHSHIHSRLIEIVVL